MKAHEIISEAEVKPYLAVALQEEKLMGLLVQHCSESLLNAKTPIWRGMADHNQLAVYINTSNSVRKSENTSNQYTLLMDNSPFFARFPKRSKSLICSTSDRIASGFTYGSDIYAMFPYNGTPIGICPAFDMWHSEIKVTMKNITGQDIILYHGRFIGLTEWLQSLGFPDTSYGAMVAHQKDPDFFKWLASKIGLGAAEKQQLKFIPRLHECMAPENTGFGLASPGTFNPGHEASTPGLELWFAGSCIAIRRDVWFQMFMNPKTHVSVHPMPRAPA